MPPAMTNIKEGSNKVDESVRNEATLEGFVMPPITRPHPKENPLKNSIVYGRNEEKSLFLAARVQIARASMLATVVRYSNVEKTFELNGAGERITEFTPRTDAVFMIVADAKPAIMNMPVT